jgi:predicted amidohydrolase
MNEITVALLQLTAHGDDLAANLATGEAACRRARALGADIALFPELWSAGATFHAPRAGGDRWRAPGRWPAGAPVDDDADTRAAIAAWQARAIDRDGPFVAHFRRLARELDLAIALTYLERWPGAPRNTVSLIDRRGELALTYAKVHTCDFDLPEAALTPGDDFAVAMLDTAAGAVAVGAMICYDREFPESARVLMLKGAELILTPNACMLDPLRLAQFRARAFENMVGVAMANYAAPQQNGHSVAYDPIGYRADGAPRDTLIVEAGEREGIYLAPFDLAALREWRQRETWGNAFRRPHRYGALTAAAVRPPFVRVNAAGEPYDPTRR